MPLIVESEDKMVIGAGYKSEYQQVQELAKQLGYEGCRNCQHQIAPLRMCKWAEQGGDGKIHFLCPKWDKADH